eukprot:6440989-Karenia_brevis.AAC.1
MDAKADGILVHTQFHVAPSVRVSAGDSRGQAADAIRSQGAHPLGDAAQIQQPLHPKCGSRLSICHVQH